MSKLAMILSLETTGGTFEAGSSLTVFKTPSTLSLTLILSLNGSKWISLARFLMARVRISFINLTAGASSSTVRRSSP